MLYLGRVEMVWRLFAATPNERAEARMDNVAFSPFFNDVKSDGFHARDGDAALVRRHGKEAPNPFDTAYMRPLYICLDARNVPNVEQTRLRRLLARRCDGRFHGWSPFKSV